jgi:two-component system chemotaxis sensor kinase CheA
MSGSRLNQDKFEALQRQVEELAATFVLADPSTKNVPAGADVAGILRLLANAAMEVGWTEGASLIQEIASSCSTRGWSECGAGIARLQSALQALESETTADESRLGTLGGALSQDRELMSDFVLEAREHLILIETHLLRLERDPGDMEAIHAVFRSFHTVKGLAGFLELIEIRDLAHEVETVLDMARNAQLMITSKMIDVVLEAKDFLSRCIERVDAVLAGKAVPAPPECAKLLEKVRQLPTESDSSRQGPVQVTSGNTPEGQPAGTKSPGSAGELRAVKVDTVKLDFLVDMVGEMVIAQSLIRHDPDLAALDKPRLVRNLSQLARITEEVQKSAMSMRMVPIKQLFRKMSRLVRDLSRKSGKDVELETEGDETELDRNIVEELADPLMHMIRNAVDHGVEDAGHRRLAGKPVPARVALRARHQSGRVLIEVADDGRGLDRERIWSKAVDRGLVAEGNSLSDGEVYNLIFQPGFSTAEKVTDVSGRGVGMDVVKKQITKLRGRVDIYSTTGRGTTFQIKLPLTLAIIDGLIVALGAEKYVLPIAAVREVLQPKREMLFTVENRAEMALVRNELIPVIRLRRYFALSGPDAGGIQGVFVLVESDGRKFCLLVDALKGKQEVVIKSLGETFKQVIGISGGAILGDGRVGLILDVDAICGGVVDAVH